MPQTPNMRRLETESDMSGKSLILWNLLGFHSAALRAIEVDRYAYSIRYHAPNQTSRPGSRRYFAVTRETDPIVVELDQCEWWPRGLK